MRLIDIKRSINIAKENFDVNYSNGNNVFYINGISRLKVCLQELIKCGFLPVNNEFIDEVFITNANSLSSDGTTYNARVKFLDYVGFLVENLYSWINSYVPYDQEEDVVNIKMPNSKTFDELTKVSKELHFAFSPVVNDYEGGKIEIVQFDHGSFWCIVKVGTAALLVAGLVWSGAVVAKKIIECRSSYEVFKNVQLRNDMIKELKDLAESEVKLVVAQEAEMIQNEHFNKEDNEQLERIKNSIYNISELILKGTEIQPSLSAPEEVENLFPDFNKLPLIESKVKRLPE